MNKPELHVKGPISRQKLPTRRANLARIPQPVGNFRCQFRSLGIQEFICRFGTISDRCNFSTLRGGVRNISENSRMARISEVSEMVEYGGNLSRRRYSPGFPEYGCGLPPQYLKFRQFPQFRMDIHPSGIRNNHAESIAFRFNTIFRRIPQNCQSDNLSASGRKS